MRLNVFKRFPTLAGPEEVWGAVEALSKAMGTTPASSSTPASHSPFLTFPLEKKEQSKIYQAKTFEGPVLTQPNHSAFLSLSLSLAPDYGLQTSSQ